VYILQSLTVEDVPLVILPINRKGDGRSRCLFALPVLLRGSF
jgi:hypothetical protein